MRVTLGLPFLESLWNGVRLYDADLHSLERPLPFSAQLSDAAVNRVPNQLWSAWRLTGAGGWMRAGSKSGILRGSRCRIAARASRSPGRSYSVNLRPAVEILENPRKIAGYESEAIREGPSSPLRGLSGSPHNRQTQLD
jgi:hypothetical protein